MNGLDLENSFPLKSPEKQGVERKKFEGLFYKNPLNIDFMISGFLSMKGQAEKKRSEKVTSNRRLGKEDGVEGTGQRPGQWDLLGDWGPLPSWEELTFGCCPVVCCS